MTVGVWKMKEDGQFELLEPYATMLAEAKMSATAGWRNGLLDYLNGRCPYTRDELIDELLTRVHEGGMTASEIVEEFVLEALEGDL